MAGTVVVSTLNDSSGVLATQNGMTGIAKAWVNCTATSSPTILGSYNVSSVTYSGTGIYTITFTTAMPNTNYSAVSGGNYNNNTNNYSYGVGFNSISTTSINGLTWNATGPALWNSASGNVMVAIFSS